MTAIKVHNSLQPGAPVPFVPRQEGAVSWYACGPTVYDLCHLGHARNYVSTDIIRRILMHHFGLAVNFVINITDIDDKIIVRARRRRLFELEREKKYSSSESRKLVLDAFEAYAKANLPLLLAPDAPLDETTYADRRNAYSGVLSGGTLSGEGKPGDAEAKARMHISNTDAAAAALKSESESESGLIDGAEEVLLPYLDSLYKETIDTSDQSIFTILTKTMEQEFLNDMAALNVLPPDHITRVTEYVPKIVSFVETIVNKGFAYEAEGSVYFDIAAFEAAGNPYARLRPESRNDKALQEEGEGTLSKALEGKKRAGDFALWKRSKPGEPWWPSPWGNGRPGWHIECSVMASDKLGSQMDVHSGGIDLAFPHHDNELAQSEAYFHECGEHTWVRYFLHMGHLSIAGSKMSKSLKNFETIQDALRTGAYTPRGMRIVFLMGRWNDGVEVSPDLRKQADSWENTVDNFFTIVKSRLADAGEPAGVQFLSLTEEKPHEGLINELDTAKRDLDAALCDSFNTPEAMRIMLQVIRSANIELSSKAPNLQNVKAVAQWITKMVGIFGLDAHAVAPYDKTIGWALAGTDADPKDVARPYAAVFARVTDDIRALALNDDTLQSFLNQSPDAEFADLEEAGERNPETLALPYLRAISRLRHTLRTLVPSITEKSTKTSVLSLCDRIRDDDLTPLGVQLDDATDGSASTIKFVSAEKLLAAQREKRELADQKRRAKEEQLRKREADEQARWERAKVSPKEMFKVGEYVGKYSAYDDAGVPTRLADGGELPKSQAKKVVKEWERQSKLHAEWLAKENK